MTRVVLGAGIAILFAACTDANPTRPEPADLQPSFTKSVHKPASDAYVITTYYWADDAWVEHASWPDPTMGEDAQIFIHAGNTPPGYPATEFTIDNVLAFGDTDFPDGLVDDFEDGVIGDVWGGANGGPCRDMSHGATSCEQLGVMTFVLPEGPAGPHSQFVGLETQVNVLHGEYDVQLDFSANVGFHESPRQSFLWLAIGQWEGHHAQMGLFTERYLSADDDWIGQFTTHRRTGTDQLQGKLRVKRTAVRDGGRVVESASGSGSFRVFTQTDDWRTFSFTASRHADGTVSGRWQRIRRREGNASEEMSHGVVTCMLIVGNEAWLGGHATSGIWSEPPNNSVRWRIMDGGEGAGAGSNQISLQYTGGTPRAATNWCANTYTTLELFDIEAGNIQIRGK